MTIEPLTGTRPSEASAGLHQRLELDISGMTCAACAARIEKKLNKLDGVQATVNYGTERAVVLGLDPGRSDEAVAAVEQAGYGASPVVEGAEPDGYANRIKLLRNRLIVAALLTVPLGDAAIVLALSPQMRFPGWQWLLLLCSLPVVFWCALPFHRAAWRNLRHGSTSMDTLVSLGVLAAFTWSLVSTIIGAEDTGGFWVGYGIAPAGADTLYLEVASAVTTFLLGGRYIEARSKRAARGVLSALASLAPSVVRVIRDGTEQLVDIGALRVGERFAVRPGERIATDGHVVLGSSAIDASMMTGEPTPREVTEGHAVLGGTINTTGALIVEADRIGAHTQLAQMAAMAEQAQARKASVQTLVDRIVSLFVPIVLAIAVLTLAGWLMAGGSARHAFSAALSVLIIACPCALGLATPTALMVGVGRAGQLGILIKGPDALESSGQIDTVVLDKTGTLTTGRMTLRQTIGRNGWEVDRLHRVVAAVEAQSEHPIGRAIADGVDHAGATQVTAVPGLGATGLVDEGAGPIRVLVGTPNLLARDSVPVPDDALQLVKDAAQQGHTAVLAACDGVLAGVFVVADALKDSAAGAVAQLRAMGLRTVLLTGDHRRAAEFVGAQLGVDEVIAEVMPTDKAQLIEKLRAEGARVAMVGDGINDAAAMAAANLGLAVISGTDVALKSADIILVRPQLDVIPDAIALSRRTLRIIKGNLAWAFAYNVAAIPLAAAGLLNPLIAGLAMSLSSVFVVTNSMRLRRFQPGVRGRG